MVDVDLREIRKAMYRNESSPIFLSNFLHFTTPLLFVTEFLASRLLYPVQVGGTEHV